MTKATPIVCIAMRYEPYWMTEPAEKVSSCYHLRSENDAPMGPAKLMPPSTPRLNIAARKPRSCTNQISAIEAGMSASNGASKQVSACKTVKHKATYHAETLQSSSARKRTEALDFRSPEARHRKAECGRKVYGTFTDLNGERIANKAGSCDGDDTRAVASKRESLKRHIELLRKRHKRWGEQGTDSYDRLAVNSQEDLLCAPPTHPHP